MMDVLPLVYEQKAPYPQMLEDLVRSLRYRPGWNFRLQNIDRGQGSTGLTFMVLTKGFDTYHPERGENYRVWHYFPVPPAAYNRESWQHWLLQRLLEVESHEACEFFVIDGKRPYAPHHGPGNDPYMIFVHGSDEDKRTMYTGEVLKPKDPTLTATGKKQVGGMVFGTDDDAAMG